MRYCYKPNERSSHSKVVLRGGGIIFLIGVWIWAAFFGFQYPWFLVGVTLAAGVSFIDDIRSLPDSVRLAVQFVAMAMMFRQLDILQPDLWWAVILVLIVCVGIKLTEGYVSFNAKIKKALGIDPFRLTSLWVLMPHIACL